jgi:hypothetical protein
VSDTRVVLGLLDNVIAGSVEIDVGNVISVALPNFALAEVLMKRFALAEVLMKCSIFLSS